MIVREKAMKGLLWSVLSHLTAGEPPITRLCGNEYGKPPCRPVVDTYSRHCPVASDRLDLGARSSIMVPVNDIKTGKGVNRSEGKEEVGGKGEGCEMWKVLFSL